MSNSIFHGTMSDMTYQDIEELIREGAAVLLPVAVIEEHGPHLPLGTDTYLTYSIFRHIQEELRVLGVKSVIAPPFYYGINVATSGFPGSFTVKVETMKAVLKDTIECLYNWGFKNVYLLNMHGDHLHSKTLLETTKEIYEAGIGDKKIYNLLSGFSKRIFGLSGDEPYVLISEDEEQSADDTVIEEPYLDIHAGGFETSLMLLDFKDLVDEQKARTLKSSETTFELLPKWQKGGSEGREVTPLGYCGDPSNIDLKSAKECKDAIAKSFAELIAESMRKQASLGEFYKQ